MFLGHQEMAVCEIQAANLIPKHPKTHQRILRSLATDSLALKHQTIITHGTDNISIVLHLFHTKISNLQSTVIVNYIIC